MDLLPVLPLIQPLRFPQPGLSFLLFQTWRTPPLGLPDAGRSIRLPSRGTFKIVFVAERLDKPTFQEFSATVLSSLLTTRYNCIIIVSSVAKR
jgi:hypothetical protein